MAHTMANPIVVVLLLGCFGVAQSAWYGFSPVANAPQTVELSTLRRDASIDQTIARLQLNHSAAEHVSVDSFRCRPGGTFCLFTTTDGTDSWLYNVSNTAGHGIISITSVPKAVIHNLHVDLATGAAYTVALAPNNTTVISIDGRGTITSLVDLTSYVDADSTVLPGGTTQCSDNDDMWVTVRSTTGKPDRVVYFNLKTRAIKSTMTLQGFQMASMWSQCIDQLDLNHLAGLVVNGSELMMGFIDKDGTFSALSRGTIPPPQSPSDPYVVTGLLSEPLFADFFFPLYPASAVPGGPATAGYFAYGEFKAGNAMEGGAISYYLTGAAIA